jgi:hypothetical protein
MDLAELRRNLSTHRQEKTLRFVDQLPEPGKKKLLGQLSALDLDSISKLIKEYVTQKPHIAVAKAIRPVKVYPHKPTGEQKDLYERAQKRGYQLIKEGKVGAFLARAWAMTGPRGNFR